MFCCCCTTAPNRLFANEKCCAISATLVAIVILVGILGLTGLMKTPTAMNATFVGLGSAALVYLAINYCRSTVIFRSPPPAHQPSESETTPPVYTPPQTPAPPQKGPADSVHRYGTLRGAMFSSQPIVLNLS